MTKLYDLSVAELEKLRQYLVGKELRERLFGYDSTSAAKELSDVEEALRVKKAL